MAILKSGNLSFDFQYAGFEYGWVQYHIFFCWKDEGIVKGSLLKRGGEYWNSRPEGAFLANEDGGDGFIPLLKKVLEKGKADYWEPLEPDIIIAIYPEEYFPFLPSHYNLVYESEKHKAKRKAREELKKEKGKLPDDTFTFIAFVDAYNFKEADAYYGEGFSIQLIVKRHELEDFLIKLEAEYEEFKQRHKVDEWIKENALSQRKS